MGIGCFRSKQQQRGAASTWARRRQQQCNRNNWSMRLNCGGRCVRRVCGSAKNNGRCLWNSANSCANHVQTIPSSIKRLSHGNRCHRRPFSPRWFRCESAHRYRRRKKGGTSCCRPHYRRRRALCRWRLHREASVPSTRSTFFPY